MSRPVSAVRSRRLPPPARAAWYLATFGCVALLVLSIVGEPPHPAVTGALVLAYLLLVTFGVIFARFQMFADVMTAGEAAAHGVALTFDDGPDPRVTPRVLDLLDEHDAKATFFVIGRKAERFPEIVRDIHARGHALGVHGYVHDRIFSLRTRGYVQRDLEKAIDVIERTTGERPRLFRAPIGHISPAIARVVRRLHLQTIGWSVRGLDGWSGATGSSVADRVTSGLRDGAIVLLHDASERGDFQPASVEALPSILEAAAEQRLPLVRVDAWLDQP